MEAQEEQVDQNIKYSHRITLKAHRMKESKKRYDRIRMCPLQKEGEWHSNSSSWNWKMLNKIAAKVMESRKITNESKDSITCSICHVRLHSPSTLYRHLRRFMGSKYPCTKCGSTFAREGQLLSHKTDTYRSSSNSSSNCPICNQFFRVKTHIQSHMYHSHYGWDKILPIKSNLTSESVKTETIFVKDNIKDNPNLKTNHNTTQHQTTLSKSLKSLPITQIITSEDQNTSINETLNIKTNDFTDDQTTVKNKEISLLPSLDAESKRFADNFYEFSHETNENTDEVLRNLYSLQECYVLLRRIDTTNVRGINKTSTINEIDNVFEKQAEVSYYQSNNDNDYSTGMVFDYTDQYSSEANNHGFCEVPDTTFQPTAKRKNVKKKHKPIKCPSCDLIFDNVFDKKEHYRDVHTSLPSLLCDKYFTCKDALLQHYRKNHLIHKDNEAYCICGMLLSRRGALEIHFYPHIDKIQRVNKPRSRKMSRCNLLKPKIKCELCGEMFWIKSCLIEHEYQHHRIFKQSRKPINHSASSHSKLVKINKSTVPVTSTARLQLTKNVLPTRVNKIEDYVCNICDTKFKSVEFLSVHQKRYSGFEKHCCSFCETVFPNSSLLKLHILSTHDSQNFGRYVFSCDVCKQGFTRHIYKNIHTLHIHHNVDMNKAKTSMIMHSYVILEPDLNDITAKKCHVCHLIFTDLKRFIDHIIYYQKDEDMDCNICGVKFEGQHSAHRHNKKIHYSPEMQNAYTHTCTICEERFMYKSHVHAHMVHVHDDKHSLAKYDLDQTNFDETNPQIKAVRNSNGHQYICGVCEISFPTDDLLAEHENENLNDGEYSCGKCSRKCVTASILLDHLCLNHSNYSIEGSTKCRLCKENFLTRLGFVLHIKHFHTAKNSVPSEFWFENAVMSPVEFGNKDLILIPANKSIASTVTFHNIARSIDSVVQESATIENTDNSGNDLMISTDPTCDMASFHIDSPSKMLYTESGSVRTAESPTKTEIYQNDKSSIQCVICGFHCVDSVSLAAHIAQYSNTGDYMCEICDRKFTCASFYQKHKIKHFCPHSSNVYFCSTCDEGFKTFISMKIHAVHLHNLILDENQVGVNDGATPSDSERTTGANVGIDCYSISQRRFNEMQSGKTVISDRNVIPYQAQSEAIHAASINDADGYKSPLNSVMDSNNKTAHANSEQEYGDFPKLHTEIFEDEILFVYQCSHCKETYSTHEQLQKHLLLVHRSDNLNQSNNSNDPSTSSEAPVSCYICDSEFNNTNELVLHRKNVHSLGPIEVQVNAINHRISGNDDQIEGLEIIKNQKSVGRNRFYLNNNNNILGLPSKVYRYSAPIICEICNSGFKSKDLLNVHRECIHTVRSDCQIQCECSGEHNVPAEKSSEIQTQHPSNELLLRNDISSMIGTGAIVISPMSQSTLEKPKPKLGVASVIRPNLSCNVHSTEGTGARDIGVMNTSALREHETNPDRLTSVNKESISTGLSTFCENKVNDSISHIKALSQLVRNFAPLQNNYGHNAKELPSEKVETRFDFEPVWISYADTVTVPAKSAEINVENSTSDNLSPSSKSNNVSQQPLQLFVSSTVNQNVGKLKVRPFAKIVSHLKRTDIHLSEKVAKE